MVIHTKRVGTKDSKYYFVNTACYSDRIAPSQTLAWFVIEQGDLFAPTKAFARKAVLGREEVDEHHGLSRTDFVRSKF